MSVNPITDPKGAAEFAAGKAAARAGRRAFAQSPDSTFVKAMRGAIHHYLEAREQGISREDACRGLEEVLRAAWPKSVSKFTPDCTNCDDTGYIDRVCWDQQRCGREVCVRNAERQHGYVDICHCPKGDMKRRRVATTEDAIAAAGRTTRRKSSNWRQVGK